MYVINSIVYLHVRYLILPRSGFLCHEKDVFAKIKYHECY